MGEVVTRDARRVRKLRGWPNEPRASVRVSNDAPHTSVVPFVPGASLLGQRGGATATAASFEWAKHPGGCRRVGEPRRTPCARQTGLQGLWDVLLAGTHRASGSSGGVGRRREVALPFSRSLADLGVTTLLATHTLQALDRAAIRSTDSSARSTFEDRLPEWSPTLASCAAAHRSIRSHSLCCRPHSEHLAVAPDSSYRAHCSRSTAAFERYNECGKERGT